MNDHLRETDTHFVTALYVMTSSINALNSGFHDEMVEVIGSCLTLKKRVLFLLTDAEIPQLRIGVKSGNAASPSSRPLNSFRKKPFPNV